MRPLLCVAALAALLLPLARGQGEGAILRPTEGAALPAGSLVVVGFAPDGKLELDGDPVAAERPFPGVLRATIEPLPGEHTLALIWAGERRTVHFFVGGDPPGGYRPFRPHPPGPVRCTRCHGLSRRGRFRFQGGCFGCHEKAAFVSVHQHEPHVLEQCGICHNAHGSTAPALLVLPRKQACKQCHN